MPPSGGYFFWRRVGIRKLNPSCRWQLGRRQLDGGETIIFCVAENANESLLLRAAYRAAIFSDKAKCIRTHPQVVRTDVHNWLQYFSMTSKVCKGSKKARILTGILAFFV